MGRLKNLKIGEFSIVRGSDKQPANPEAVVTFYKSARASGGATDSSAKEIAVPPTVNAAPAAQPKQKSLAEQVADTLHSIFKGTSTRTSVSTSRYESTDTITEPDPNPAASAAATADQGTTTVIITDAIAKGAPAAQAEPAASPVAKTATAQPAADPIPGISQFTQALDPITKAVTSLDSRLAALESRSTGSQRVKSFPASSIQVLDNSAAKFPEFAKFLSAVSGLTPGQKLTKATITTSGWSYGLTVTEAQAFIDNIVDESVLLKLVRTVQMPSPTYHIDKIGLGGNVLVKGTAGEDPGDTVSLSGPTQVELISQEVIAIVSIGDDAIEDNIEGEAFVQHLLSMISRAAACELEQAAIHGDSEVPDLGILDRWDGYYKLAKAAGAHVIDAMGDPDRYWPGADGGKATRLLKAVPTKYRQDYRNLGFLLHNDLYLDYNDVLAAKGMSEAWMAITGVTDVPLRSVKNVRVPMLKTDMVFDDDSVSYTDGTVVILTDLRNLIFGIQRQIKIEPQRNARKRATDYVLSMRCVPQIENADAIGIYDHAQVKA